jgi:hypothetical protein
MNYILAALFAVVGLGLLIWNKTLSDTFSAFYVRRFAVTFGGLGRLLGWDNPNSPFNRFLYRGFVITAGIIFLLFAVAAWTGTNFMGPSPQPTNSLLQQTR